MSIGVNNIRFLESVQLTTAGEKVSPRVQGLMELISLMLYWLSNIL